MECLDEIFSFLPLEKREELGTVSTTFSHAAKESHITKKTQIAFEKTRRAEFFNRHLDKVKWSQISVNEGLPTEFFLRHEDKVVWKWLSRNQEIPKEFLETHIKDLHIPYLETNWTIPAKFFFSHPELSFKWDRVFTNRVIGFSDVEWYFSSKDIYHYPDKDATIRETFRKWVERCDLQTYRVTLPGELEETEVFLPVAMAFRNLPTSWLDANMDILTKGFNWRWIMAGVDLPIEFLEGHLDMIIWDLLVVNQNIPAEFFERHLDKLIETKTLKKLLLKNRKIPAEFFEKHARYVDWRIVLERCTLSQDFLERHLKHLDWSAISGNDSVPFEFLEEHLDKLDWHRLCLGQERVLSGCFSTAVDGDLELKPDDSHHPEFCPWP